MSKTRRLARAIARHGASVMPPAHADWGRAMAAEIDAIPTDRLALSWALSCMWACYRVRSTTIGRPVLILARVALAGIIALMVLINLPPLLMVVGYLSGNTDFAVAMSGATAGDSLKRFIPLIQEIAPWMLTFAFLRLGLFLAAAVALAAGWRRAIDLFIAGIVVQAAVVIGQRMDAGYMEAQRAVYSDAEMRSDLLFWVVEIVLVIAIVWLVRPRRRRRV